MQKELNTIKNDIATAVELIHYDPNKPAIIETDASLKGIGTVLTQDSKPVCFLSKALTPSEANYTNIERELLAILFACEKLHRYTFGRKIIVHTDHKPLQAIFQKPVSLAPSRLQRMLLCLSKYDTQVKYASRPLELLGVDVVQFQHQRALVTVDYYSGFLTYDTLSSETTEADTKALNNIFRKFGLPERIISDNGACFKSEKF